MDANQLEYMVGVFMRAHQEVFSAFRDIGSIPVKIRPKRIIGVEGSRIVLGSALGLRR